MEVEEPALRIHTVVIDASGFTFIDSVGLHALPSVSIFIFSFIRYFRDLPYITVCKSVNPFVLFRWHCKKRQRESSPVQNICFKEYIYRMFGEKVPFYS